MNFKSRNILLEIYHHAEKLSIAHESISLVLLINFSLNGEWYSPVNTNRFLVSLFCKLFKKKKKKKNCKIVIFFK